MSECIVLDARKGIFDASQTISKRERETTHPRSQEGLGRPVVGRRTQKVQSSRAFFKHEQERGPSSVRVILTPLNEGAGHTQRPIYTFGVYVEQVFLPAVAPKWKESTRMTTENRMLHHLLPAFGKCLLLQMTREQMQAFLHEKALNSSHSTVDHLRWDLKSIFKMAESEGFVPFNPAASLYTPPGKPEGEKLVLTPSQVRQALGVLDARDRLIFRLAVFEGLRPGEILALRLGDVFESHIEIVRRVYKGTFDTSKGRKGKRTARKAALSTGTAMELALWRTCLLKTSPEDYLFPSERNTALYRDNIWYRGLKPKLEKVGLEWATFQVLRRTNANLSRKAKVDDKVAADQRGHGLGGAWKSTPTAILSRRVKQ
jgi:integrase